MDAPTPASGDDEAPSPRADLIAAALWITFGAAVAVGAWRMDRLERLSINPYEAPGLVPGLLGALLVLLGLALALRALRQGALGAGVSTGVAATSATVSVAGEGAAGGPVAGPFPSAGPGARADLGRMATVFALTLGYALVLIGTGLPFWGATFVFITVFIGLLDRERQQALGRPARAQWVRAAVYGAAWSALVTLSFQHIFLVRLP
jgi:hypothetical protein